MSPARMSRVEEALRAVLAFYEAFNRHDVDAMAALVGDDCLYESFGPAPDGVEVVGREAIATFWRDFFRRSPGARVEIEDATGLGRQCVARWRCQWTDAVGDTAHVRGADLVRVEDGLIREMRSYAKG